MSVDLSTIREQPPTTPLVLALAGEVAELRGLLAKALPWIDPNDRHEDYLLTVAVREALGKAS